MNKIVTRFNHSDVAGLSRRHVLGVLAAGAVATVPGLAAADAPVTVRVGTPVGAVQGVKAGIDAGYFQAEGIDIRFVILAGGPNILAATVGGSVDIGYADLFAWAGALENGFSLQFLQSANGRGTSDYIIVGPKSGITAPRDLRGKKIGVEAHAQSKLRVTLYLEKFGLSANDVHFVTVNQRDTVGAALAAGQIDAAIQTDPDVAIWQQQYGVVPLEGRPWQQVPPTVTTAGFFATKDWLAANGKIAEGFVRAARKGAARFNALSAADKAKVYLKYDKIDLFALEKTNPGVIERANDVNQAHDGPVDLAATTQWLQIAKDHGVIKNVVDLKALLYPTALEPRA